MELIIKTKVFFAIILLQMFWGNAFAQLKSVRVEKRSCWHERDMIQGYKLVVVLEYKDTIISTKDNNYDLSMLLDLPDSTKLAIVEELLKFNGDLSICCRKVYKYYYEPIETTCAGRPESRTFPISIDALYMINRIVHPYGISMYSCFPVVIDWKSKKELNNCPELIADYYKIYEDLFKEAVSTKKIGNGFQFNTTKYAWYGADEGSIRNIEK